MNISSHLHIIPKISPLYGNRWISITHWGRVMHICVGNIPIISSDNGLPPGQLQWNLNSNSIIDENTFENVICEMMSILFRHQCVKLCWAFMIYSFLTWIRFEVGWSVERCTLTLMGLHCNGHVQKSQCIIIMNKLHHVVVIKSYATGTWHIWVKSIVNI